MCPVLANRWWSRATLPGSWSLCSRSTGLEMFELEIDNDLKFVDDAIREYWDLPKRKKLVATKQPTIKGEK